MKRLAIIALLHLFFVSLNAQVNYVLNPSLEQYDSCINNDMAIRKAHHWSCIDSNADLVFGSPLYINTCDAGSNQSSAPLNPRFYRFPRTGNAMAQSVMTIPSFGEYRDYLQGRLYKPLIAGKEYCVAFYVIQEQQSYYSVNHIAAYLDNGIIDTAIHTAYYPQTMCTPQIQENYVISDTVGWTKIEGNFIATGNEKFITIGNFTNDTNTAKVIFNSQSIANEGTYLIDDVSVIESDTKAFAWGSDTLYKGYLDSFLLGRNETIPGIKWWRDGVLIDTLNAGIWCKDDTVGNYHTYIVSQTLCGLTTYDTVVVSVGLTSINVKNVKNVGNVKVWPNPAGDVLHVEANIDLYVSILSVEGKVLIRDCFVPRNDAKGVNIQGLAKGVYFLQITDSEGNKEVRKIVKE